MRAGRVSAGLAVDVLQLPDAPRTWIRFDADEAAMRLDVGVGPVLQPAQWIGAASEIGKRRFDLRTFPEPFVESFPESTERERIAENKNADAVRWRRRVLMRGRLHFLRGQG